MAEPELRRESPIPLYFQLQELLKEKIEAAAWHPGELIPSEGDLCETYDVSRTVVRQALSVLEQDGQLRRVRGRGTFVSAPKIDQRVGGLSRLLASPGPGHEVVVLDHRTERPPKRVGEQLHSGTDEEILRVMSLLRLGDAAVALFDSFFPLSDASSIAELMSQQPPAGLTSGERFRGVDLTRTNVAIETSFCSPWEAEQLEIPVRGAVFVTSCTEFRRDGEDDRPFEVVRGVYRADRVQLRFEVASDGKVPAALWQIADA